MISILYMPASLYVESAPAGSGRLYIQFYHKLYLISIYGSYLVHYLPYEKRPKTGTILKRILRGWRTAPGFAPGNKGNYKVPDTD